MSNKVAINALGRIGRAALKLVLEQPQLELVAVNELGSVENMAYLLKYDTVYGRYERQVEVTDGKLVIDGRPLVYRSERDLGQLPWDELGVDLVFECTGLFTNREGAEKHLRGSEVGRPVRPDQEPRFADHHPRCQPARWRHGHHFLRELHYEQHHSRGGSPRSPLWRREGAANHCARIHRDSSAGRQPWRLQRSAPRPLRGPELRSVQHRCGLRYRAGLARDAGSLRWCRDPSPVVVGSLSDLVFLLSRDTTSEEVNDIFRREAATDRYREVLGVTDEPLVSADIIKDPRASIVQLDLTRVVGGNLVKVMSWYDNEWGFTNQMVKVAIDQLGRDRIP
jgi:glyceraldehyde 3-phosphate dehydrogenase